ncbi:MAG: hypothetical protein JWO96_27 [Candidatus Saccharibacteria bacterium]|nr:hypothetical protein [Candidatus Saccharibacteria bacterium]
MKWWSQKTLAERLMISGVVIAALGFLIPMVSLLRVYSLLNKCIGHNCATLGGWGYVAKLAVLIPVGLVILLVGSLLDIKNSRRPS